MGHEMIGKSALLLTALLLAPTTAARAQSDKGESSHAVGADVFYSNDADDTEVLRVGANLDFVRRGPENYLGLRLEKAWFNPIGRGWTGRERIYLRAAGDVGGGWKMAANVGTDGDTVLGAASIHDESRFRKEFFLEREILETPQGLDRGIYYTFGGAALDLPVNDRNLFTVVAGLQEFTGDNVRTHGRANYIHVLKPEIGLSAQLRTRWFRNSDPREYDYYSPRWYAQLLPVLQMRRTTDSGWRYLIAGGIGAQRDSESDWRRSSYINAQATSPQVVKGWAVTGAFLFSETPTTSGQSYNYSQFSAGLVRAF